MKTTIVLTLSVLLLLPGVKKSSTQEGTKVVVSGLYNAPAQDLNLLTTSFNDHLSTDTFNQTVKNDDPYFPGSLPASTWTSSEKEVEADISIEEWMTRPGTWNINTDQVSIRDSETFNVPDSVDLNQEKDYVIEIWMTEPYKWVKENQSSNL